MQRLDLETDGPVLVAKSWRAQRFLQVQLKEHIFSKAREQAQDSFLFVFPHDFELRPSPEAYMCLVHGKVENRTQHIKARFAELGTSGHQVMVKYDAINDPFYERHKSGWWQKREQRVADTFLKPLAYYKKKDDGSEYTLVYVNILSGITHQVRITMQSIGHPLVSDDRYLPREQAMADCQWCPRNFLCEVRSDWFDMCGPYQDSKRRRYARISIENPLPKLFQDLLEQKLHLVQKLDPHADLYQGCQYWALGDEQLMIDHPKDTEYQKKVMRWGIRRGIHLDAMDRLLLLKREEIDRVMAEYRSPDDEDGVFWVCPVCMSFNHPTQYGDGTTCKGFLGNKCASTKKVSKSENVVVPEGWRDYLADPTLHLLAVVNPLLLSARKEAISRSRPNWDRPPGEEEGEQATPDQIESLHKALLVLHTASAF